MSDPLKVVIAVWGPIPNNHVSRLIRELSKIPAVQVVVEDISKKMSGKKADWLIVDELANYEIKQLDHKELIQVQPMPHGKPRPYYHQKRRW